MALVNTWFTLEREELVMEVESRHKVLTRHERLPSRSSQKYSRKRPEICGLTGKHLFLSQNVTPT